MSEADADRSTAIRLALDWLTGSDILNRREHSTSCGGLNQGYDWRQRRYPFVYSEITGYAASFFVAASRWTGDERYAHRALQAVDFLQRHQNTTGTRAILGAFPHGLSLPDLTVRRQYYSFDAAMCLQGILDVNEVMPSPQLRQSARATGDWLVNQMQSASGAFLSMYDEESGQAPHAGDQFFSDNGCLHAKHAVALLKLSAATGDDRYGFAARRVCNWVLDLQYPDGSFRATERIPDVVSHAHCYATEGLLYAYHATGERRYLNAARRAAEWLLRTQNIDGSINIAYKRPWRQVRRHIAELMKPCRVTDATAQAVRIWLIMYGFDGDERWLRACRSAERFLLRMQCCDSSDRNAVGGFYYCPDDPMMFTWCALFAAQGLYELGRCHNAVTARRLVNELF